MTSAVEALSLEQCPECEGTGGHGDWIENQPVCPTCGGTGARVPGLRRECGYITMYYTISRGQIWSTRLLPPSGFPDGISPKCRTIDRAATPHIRTAKWASECKGGCGGRGWVLIPSAEVMGVLVRAALQLDRVLIEIWVDQLNLVHGKAFQLAAIRLDTTPEEALAAAIIQAIK